MLLRYLFAQYERIQGESQAPTPRKNHAKTRDGRDVSGFSRRKPGNVSSVPGFEWLCFGGGGPKMEAKESEMRLLEPLHHLLSALNHLLALGGDIFID